MLTMDSLQDLVDSGDIDTVLMVFPGLYGRLYGKRIDAEYFIENTVPDGMNACNYLFTVDMEMEPVQGYKYANWETGYGDFHCVADMKTLRPAAWLDRSAIILCDVVEEDTGEPTSVSPRNMLRKQVDEAAKMGFTAQGASELEYYIFDETYGSAHAKHYADMERFSRYIEDYHILQGTREEPLNGAARRYLKQSGIPVEFSKGEWGPGQHELNIKYAPVLEMADRHTLYKQCFHDLADMYEVAVTFMAKVDADLAGSSCHIHLSLWDKDGKENAFAGDKPIGPVTSSDSFRWFLGGWMKHAAELMPFYAPTINSYKRYQSGSWAPTGLAWSYDNRTAGFRVVGHGKSLRIESRIPGADVNPYLAYAASMAAGLDGIRNKIEPPEMFDGDVYSAGTIPHVPTTLRDAVDRLDKSTFAREAMGDDVIDHYVFFYREEQAQYDRAVTDWEKKRYFEQI